MKPPKATEDDTKDEPKVDKAEDLFASPKVTPSYATDLFSDEPTQKPSYSDDLFADTEDDLFAKPSKPAYASNLFDDNEDDLFSTKKDTSAKGLFDDEDNDIFATTKASQEESNDENDDDGFDLLQKEHDGLDAYKAMLVIRLLQVICKRYFKNDMFNFAI